MKTKIITIAFIIVSLTSLYINGQSNTVDGFQHNSQPIGFMQNKGQVIDQNNLPQPDVKYLYNGNNFKLHLRTNSFSYELYSIETLRSFATKDNIKGVANKTQDKLAQSDISFGEEKKGGPMGIEDIPEIKIHSHRIDIELIGANPNPELIAEGRSNDYTNFYTVNCGDDGIREVYNYSKITYKNIYNNIDLVFYSQPQTLSPDLDPGSNLKPQTALVSNLKYDFIVNPGGNISDIRLKYNGADKMKLDGLDKLTIATTQGNIEEQMPLVYEVGNEETQLIANYELNENILNFNIENYDPTKILVIDPNLIWATYYGGTDVDNGYDVATDDLGNPYLVGTTHSINAISSGGFLNIYVGTGDAFLAKFNSAGVRQWATYYGGINPDEGRGVITDNLNKVYMCGYTSSTTGIAVGGHQNIYGGGSYDAFLVKFDSAGVRQWGTYYGGTGVDYGQGVSTDETGNVYLAGRTGSTNAIATVGSHQTVYGGGGDAFLVKFNSSGVRQWGAYYGGTGNDYDNVVSTDATGNVYLAGTTSSTNAIATTGSHQNICGGLYDAFLVKFNSLGVRQWGTYYGGAQGEYDNGVSTDGTGNVYLAGYTYSTNAIATASSHQNVFGGGVDAFLVKFDSLGSRQWGTYYGGTGDDGGHGVSTDGTGNVYLVGHANSVFAIATVGSHQYIFSGINYDAFLVKFNSAGVRQWGSYYGGGGVDIGYGVSADGLGNVYLVGQTSSTTAIASGGHQNVLGGNYDAFLAKFSTDIIPTIITGTISGTSFCAGDNINIPYTITGTFNAGNIFTAELSYASGSFVSPIIIGTLSSISSGTITATIPPGTPYGTGYRIRIVSSNPVVIGTDNGTNLTINPQLPVSISISANYTTICLQENIIFTAIPINGGSTPSYQWQVNGANVGTNSSSYSNSTLVNNDVVTCILTSNANCATGNPATSNSITMTVNPNLPVSVNIAASATSICSTTNVLFTATPTNGGTTPGYQWKVNGVNVGINSSTYTNSTLANNDVVTCILTSNAAPCATGNPATSNSITMIVSSPTTTASAGMDQTICSSITTMAANIPTIGTGMWTTISGSGSFSSVSSPNSNLIVIGVGTNVFLWTTSNGSCAPSIDTVLIIHNQPSSSSMNATSCNSYILNSQTYNSSGTYTQTLTNAAGCDSTITLNLIINNSSVSTMNATACNNYTLNSQTYNSSGTYTQTLSNASGCDSTITLNLIINNSTASTLNETVCDSYTLNSQVYTSSGTYIQTLTNAMGCDSIITLNLNINTVNTSVTQTGSSGENLNANTSTAIYQWIDCVNNFAPILGETNQIYTANNNGTYAVVITENGCTDTSACFDVISLGINSITFEELIHIYPNPTEGDFYIDLGGNYDQAKIEILNISGQIIYVKDWLNAKIIALSIDKAAGIYLVNIITDNHKKTYKLIKK